MKKLEKKFEKSGQLFTQIKREGDKAIYKRGTAGYEVIKIRSHNGYEIGGQKIKPGEMYPTDREWGKYGWTYLTLSAAETKFRQLG